MNLKTFFIASFRGLRSIAADIMPPSPFALIATALAFVMVGGVCAFAQDGSAPVAAVSFPDMLAKVSSIAQSAGIIIGCVGALLAAAPIANGVISLLGIKDATQRAQLEKLFNDRLHAAIQNAIQYAVTRSGLPISAVTLATILSDAVSYLQDKNPDTIAFFDLEVKQLEDLVTANWPNVFSWLKGVGLPSAVISDTNISSSSSGSPVSAEAIAGAALGVSQALRAFDPALSARVAAINAASPPAST